MGGGGGLKLYSGEVWSAFDTKRTLRKAHNSPAQLELMRIKDIRIASCE
jgi:hypothetical protein